jgi:hypothetical protein
VLNQNKEDILNIIKFCQKFNPFNIGIDISHIYPSVKDRSFCLYYSQLPEYLNPIMDYIDKNEINNISFSDTPYCIFGKYNSFVVMHPNAFAKQKPKGKLSFCKDCSLSQRCDGFFLNNLSGKEEQVLKAIK